MKVILLSVGKTDHPLLSQIIEDYRKKVNHYIPFEMKMVPDLKNRKNLSEKEQKREEAALILKMLLPSDQVVLLDDKGKQYRSTEFARYLEKKRHTVARQLVFIAGGPYGFAQEIYDRSREMISLSKMTFTHQMVRLIFAEQLYRAMTILHNEPYHHE
ncbi:MAG: 23S rRNA (pseudouridine(1915)-N(3))-methyltransferase RlmH [Proteiniphilum sp.]|jgi:23S rRNA (pseudouridine1915-N3)-methyltransferase|nr:23S rRNA (pseudouridine(1915)-N(3))-methyltransferase RlmH [Proteiniphilum sp.]MDD4158243.1 23S rRNA (pseudouridine(1915)-N(3))-methyltransferase RlmH [Proteiniphilum sp.]MDD4800912.1 23S rRNA (pseudouridine(1915)-N(3))-methyltransferase RlmH [Proteiniphilum sp.]